MRRVRIRGERVRRSARPLSESMSDWGRSKGPISHSGATVASFIALISNLRIEAADERVNGVTDGLADVNALLVGRSAQVGDRDAGVNQDGRRTDCMCLDPGKFAREVLGAIRVPGRCFVSHRRTSSLSARTCRVRTRRGRAATEAIPGLHTATRSCPCHPPGRCSPRRGPTTPPRSPARAFRRPWQTQRLRER